MITKLIKGDCYMDKLDLEKFPDGVIVKIKGTGFEKNNEEIYNYFIKIGDKLLNNRGFLYIDEYDGTKCLDSDWEDCDIDKIWELPLFRSDVEWIVKECILNKEPKIASKLIYENKDSVRTFTTTELKEKMEEILGYPIKIVND